MDEAGPDWWLFALLLSGPGQVTTLLLALIYNTWPFLLWQLVGRFDSDKDVSLGHRER